MSKDQEKLEQEFLKSYEDFADAIFRHCYFRVSDRELAKDLVQETFARIWKYLAQGKIIQNIKAFLYKTANNLIIDQYKKKKELSLDELTEAGVSLASDENLKIQSQAEAKEVLSILNKLKPAYKEALTMRYFNELSVKEIAEILGESENNISVRIHRAINDLRKILKIYE